jgi:hypothetical protein
MTEPYSAGEGFHINFNASSHLSTDDSKFISKLSIEGDYVFGSFLIAAGKKEGFAIVLQFQELISQDKSS